MMDKKTLLIAGILLVILGISGCTGNNEDEEYYSRGPGVFVTDIKADFATIDSGETMSLAVDFENRGDKTASEITGSLIRKGSFTVAENYAGVSTLSPPIDNTFSTDEFIWDITAPEVSEDRIEELQARLFYLYETDGYATINFVPRAIYREKGDAAFPADVSTSNGPVAIDIVANQPVIITESDSKACAGTIGVVCGDITDKTGCDALGCAWDATELTCGVCAGINNAGDCGSALGCTWDATESTCGGTISSCSDIATESTCSDASGCNWGVTKGIRLSLTINNVGNGRIENETLSEDMDNMCTDELDCIDRVTIKGIGGTVCSELDQELTGVKLVQGEQARKTITDTFTGIDPNAATSCQVKITAYYRYRIDSPVRSITVRKEF